MAVLDIFLNFILIASVLCLPLLMVQLTYGTSTKPRFNKLTVFSTGMLCIPLLLYMWMQRETPSAAHALASEQTKYIDNGDAEDLKFSEFFKLPVGPQGLETTARLTSLNGKKVRIRGYMVQQELAKPGFFLLTPLPTKTTEADDSMADDLPPSTVFVHFRSHAGHNVAHRQGLLEFTGYLSVGPKEESDTRVSSVRLMLGSAASHDLIASN